eukprot:9510766-Karenia_brevis.AAC.1
MSIIIVIIIVPFSYSLGPDAPGAGHHNSERPQPQGGPDRQTADAYSHSQQMLTSIANRPS